MILPLSLRPRGWRVVGGGGQRRGRRLRAGALGAHNRQVCCPRNLLAWTARGANNPLCSEEIRWTVSSSPHPRARC